MRNRFFTVLLFLSSAASAAAGDLPSPPAPRAGAGSATIVLYRPARTYGFAWPIHLRDAAGTRYKVRNGSVDTLHVPPGEVSFRIISELRGGELALTPEAGKTYYVRVGLRAGVVLGVPEVIEVTEATAKRDAAAR